MLRLRPFRNPDAKKVIEWAKDEIIFYKWSAGILGDYPLTAERLIESTNGRVEDDRYFPFIAFDENGPVGFFHLRILGDTYEKARFGFVIVDPAIRGKGYGKKMLQLGIQYAFSVYGAKEVELGVFSNNEAAYHCYYSVGFRENGMREKYTILGEEWEDVEMSYHPSEME